MEDNVKDLIEGKIKELKNNIEEEKEHKLVILLTEIIVSITLRELYEKSD
jgi:hypothetical protein